MEHDANFNEAADRNTAITIALAALVIIVGLVIYAVINSPKIGKVQQSDGRIVIKNVADQSKELNDDSKGN